MVRNILLLNLLAMLLGAPSLQAQTAPAAPAAAAAPTAPAANPVDPAAIVAGADRARKLLGWKPRHNDLDGIVASALAWESHLVRRNEAA